MRKTVFLAALYIASVAALVLPVHGYAAVQTASGNPVTFTGTVSCFRCQQDISLHKGYTRWTWAVHMVDRGDRIVLVVGNKLYALQGDKSQLVKYMEDKVQVTGDLDGQTLIVRTISRSTKQR